LGKKNCKDLGVDKDLTKFAKILIPESLKKFTIFFFKKKNGILKILIGFNEKILDGMGNLKKKKLKDRYTKWTLLKKKKKLFLTIISLILHQSFILLFTYSTLSSL
jgi:hypothetical protein